MHTSRPYARKNAQKLQDIAGILFATFGTARYIGWGSYDTVDLFELQRRDIAMEFVDDPKAFANAMAKRKHHPIPWYWTHGPKPDTMVFHFVREKDRELFECCVVQTLGLQPV